MKEHRDPKPEVQNILFEAMKEKRLLIMATRYIGRDEMQKLLGKTRITLWRMYEKYGEFPKPERTKSGLFLGWPEHVYEEWVRSAKR